MRGLALVMLLGSAALLSACKPELTFSRRDGRFTLDGDLELAGDRLFIGVAGPNDNASATLTAAGLDRLNAAVDDVEDGWDPGGCGCDDFVQWTFREEGESDLVYDVYDTGQTPHSYEALEAFIDEIWFPVSTCRQSALTVPTPDCTLLGTAAPVGIP